MSDKDAREEAREYLMEKFSDRFSMEAIASAAYILTEKVESQRTQAPSTGELKKRLEELIDAARDQFAKDFPNGNWCEKWDTNTAVLFLAGYLADHLWTQAPSTLQSDFCAVADDLGELMADLDYLGIHFDAELDKEGSGWEVIAEPEPQYFETFREAMAFRDTLTDLPNQGTQAQAAQPDRCDMCNEPVTGSVHYELPGRTHRCCRCMERMKEPPVIEGPAQAVAALVQRADE